METNMYRRERGIAFMLVSMILIPLLYGWHIYNKFIADNPALLHDFSFWGKKFFVLIGIFIASMIIIMIIFAIINKIVTNQDIPDKDDEMDKLIELKAMRVSHRVFGLSFLLAMGSQAIGMQPWVLLLILISSCFVGGIAQAVAQIYYYKKGV